MLAGRLGATARSSAVTILGVIVLGCVLPACGDSDPIVGPVGPIGPVGEDEGIPGSGNLVLETRDVMGFDRILLAGEGRVVVTLGADESLTVETDDNLIRHIDTSVEGGRLELRTEPGIDIAPTQSVSYQIGAASLAGLELSGAGSIELGEWAAEDASVVLSGVGEITVVDLAATGLDVDLTGAGMVVVAGAVATQEVLAAGAGVYEAAGLRSRTATVEARDAGAATLWVTDELEVDFSGPGTVQYYGSPEVTRRGSAAGVLTHLEEQ